MSVSRYMAMFVFGILVLTSCKNESNPEAGVLKKGEVAVEKGEVSGFLKTATFEIDGMSCAMGCANLIQSKLAALNGVKKAKVDFETKRGIIEFDDSKQTSETITETVEKIANGIYSVEKIEVTDLVNTI